MPGKGPAPKAQGERRRRNAPARGEWVDLEPLTEPVLPELPALADDDWAPNTRAVWEAWRNDPVTVLWTPADVAFAMDTIVLHNVMTPSTASEVRLRMDALGLTPKGKRDLRWRPSSEAQAPAQVTKLPQTRRLRAV